MRLLSKLKTEHWIAILLTLITGVCGIIGVIIPLIISPTTTVLLITHTPPSISTQIPTINPTVINTAIIAATDTEVPTMEPTKSVTFTPIPPSPSSIPIVLIQSATNLNCFAATPSRIQIGMRVRTTHTGLRTNIRVSNNYLAERVVQVDSGVIMEIIGGPLCGNDTERTFIWWQVRTEGGQIGWVAEGDASQNPAIYLIEPI